MTKAELERALDAPEPRRRTAIRQVSPGSGGGTTSRERSSWEGMNMLFATREKSSRGLDRGWSEPGLTPCGDCGHSRRNHAVSAGSCARPLCDCARYCPVPVRVGAPAS